MNLEECLHDIKLGLSGQEYADFMEDVIDELETRITELEQEFKCESRIWEAKEDWFLDKLEMLAGSHLYGDGMN